jgi:hypothetical protein
MTTREILSPDLPTRKVLCAVEVVDPVTQEILWRDLTVRAEGLANRPLLSKSGRFVWLREDSAWPSAITVASDRPIFEAERATPQRPANLDRATPAERLIRIVLRPTAAYEFGAGVTAIRGHLAETSAVGAAPVTNARVRIAWFDKNVATWVPAPPATARDGATNGKGDFAAYLRLVPTSAQYPDITKGYLKVQVQVTRASAPPVTRTTPATYPFVADPAQQGRVFEGLPLGRDLALAWADLV